MKCLEKARNLDLNIMGKVCENRPSGYFMFFIDVIGNQEPKC